MYIYNPIFILLILHIPCWNLSNALNLILVNNGASQKHIFIEFVRITCSWKRMEKENERIRNIWHTIKYGLNVNNISDEM